MREHLRQFHLPLPGMPCATSCHPSDPGTFIAWERDGTVWRTVTYNSGGGWQRSVVQGIQPDLLCEQAWWALDGRCILLPALGPHIGWISQDGGRNFHEVPVPWAHDVTAQHEIVTMTRTVMSPDGVIYAAWSPNIVNYRREWKLQLSRDGGTTWEKAGKIDNLMTSIIPSAHAILLLDRRDASLPIRVSGNLGMSWTSFVSPFIPYLYDRLLPCWASQDQVLVLTSGDVPTVLAFGNDGLFLSARKLDPQLQLSFSGSLKIQAIAVDPLDPKVWYAAGALIGLVRSLDRGETWMGFPVPLAGSNGIGDGGGDWVTLHFTAGAKPLLILSSRVGSVAIDDRDHQAALFPVTLDAIIASQPR
jgi:hypothetical protein